MPKEIGSHGTSMTKAGSILSTKSFTHGRGLRGTGAYFWRKSSFYERFALAWYKQALRNGTFSSDFDKSPAVLVVELNCDDDSYLDLLDIDLEEKVGLMVNTYLNAEPANRGKISKAYDFAFHEIEKEFNCKIKLIRVKVPPPDKDFTVDFYDIRALGAVPCLICTDDSIINNISSILIKDVKS